MFLRSKLHEVTSTSSNKIEMYSNQRNRLPLWMPFMSKHDLPGACAPWVKLGIFQSKSTCMILASMKSKCTKWTRRHMPRQCCKKGWVYMPGLVASPGVSSFCLTLQHGPQVKVCGCVHLTIGSILPLIGWRCRNQATFRIPLLQLFRDFASRCFALHYTHKSVCSNHSWRRSILHRKHRGCSSLLPRAAAFLPRFFNFRLRQCIVGMQVMKPGLVHLDFFLEVINLLGKHCDLGMILFEEAA